jgi:hypothetical protein
MTDSAIVSDALRVPITVQKRAAASELQPLFDFAYDQPRLGTLQRFPVARQSPPAATRSE